MDDQTPMDPEASAELRRAVGRADAICERAGQRIDEPRPGSRPVMRLGQTQHLTSSIGIPLLTRSIAVEWRILCEPNVRRVPLPAW